MGKNPKPENNTARIYEKYSDMLYRIALVHSGNSDDAMDAVQDVFLNYIGNEIRFSSEDHEKAWFIRCVINRCRDIHRKNAVRAYEDISAAENIAGKEYFSQDSIPVLEALEKLPEKIKSVMVLHYLEDLSIEQTARSLKITQSAVKMRLSRGRDSLRAILETEGFNV